MIELYHRLTATPPINPMKTATTPRPSLETYAFEFTDTFGGEANYSWVRRGTVQARSLRGAVILAKRELGLTGHRCRVSDYGDETALYPAGSCTVLFVRWEEPATV